MSTPQKLITLCGLLAIAAAAFFAPYRYAGRSVVAGEMVPVSGTVRAPLWSPPNGPGGHLWIKTDDPRWNGLMLLLGDAEMDAGRLGIEWAGIALATLALAVLAAPRRPS